MAKPRDDFDELVMRTMSSASRDRAARRTEELMGELLLKDMRVMLGKSQQQIADTLGMKQPSLSKLESQTDMQISTLRKIVEAMGGTLEFVARFPGSATGPLAVAVKLGQLNKPRQSLRGVRGRSQPRKRQLQVA